LPLHEIQPLLDAIKPMREIADLGVKFQAQFREPLPHLRTQGLNFGVRGLELRVNSSTQGFELRVEFTSKGPKQAVIEIEPKNIADDYDGSGHPDLEQRIHGT
jgi:hypothetical protein